eukprot:COSAG02_NODE_123_length_35269_cov_51.697526_30_plen_109_part_00
MSSVGGDEAAGLVTPCRAQAGEALAGPGVAGAARLRARELRRSFSLSFRAGEGSGTDRGGGVSTVVRGRREVVGPLPHALARIRTYNLHRALLRIAVGRASEVSRRAC